MTRLLFIKLIRDLRTTWFRIVMMVVAISLSLVTFSIVLYGRFIVAPEISSGYISTNPASARIMLDRGIEANQVDAIRTAALAEPGVIDATMRAVFTFQMQQEDGRLSATPLQLFIATGDDPMRIATFQVEQGSWPPPPDGVLIERAALKFLKLKVGDSLVVTSLEGKPVRLRITGVAHDPSLAPAYEERKGYGFISTASLPLLGKQPVLDELAITVADQMGHTTPSHNREVIVRTALSLADRLKQTQGLGIVQVAVPPPYQHPHQGQMKTLLMAILIFGALSLLLSAILIATMFNGLLTQQIPQIGMLKAIGARSSRILQLYLIMILLVAAAATALAFIPGIVLGREWSRTLLTGMLNMDATSLSIPGWTYATVIAAGMILPLLMTLLPLVRASRRTVREALDDRGVDRRGVTVTRLDIWLGKFRGLNRTLLIALRNIFRRRARFLLSVGLLATAGAIFVGGLNTLAGIQAIPDTLADEQRWDVEVKLDAPASATALANLVAGIPHVTHVETWTTVSTGIQYPGQINVTLTYPDQGHGSMGVTVIPLATSAFVPPPVLEGRWLRSDDIDAIVLPQTMRKILPDVHVGETTIELPIEGRLTNWRVVGIVKELFAPTCPCVSNAGFEQASGRADQANLIRIVTDRHDPKTRINAGQAATQVLADESMKVQYVRPFDWLFAVSQGHLYVLVAVFLLIALVMGIIGLIGLGSTMSTNVIERTREFGVMSAIGAPASAVRLIVVSEGIFMAVASCVVAAVPALVLTAGMDAGLGNLFIGAPVPFQVSLPAIVIWIVLVVIGAVLATLGPAVGASRLTVREALAYW
jgi:putative ABC transport system permease protein